VLTDLGPLYGLSSVSGDLIVKNNPGLPYCEVELLRQRLAGTGWTGATENSGNDETVTECE